MPGSQDLIIQNLNKASQESKKAYYYACETPDTDKQKESEHDEPRLKSKGDDTFKLAKHSSLSHAGAKDMVASLGSARRRTFSNIVS